MCAYAFTIRPAWDIAGFFVKLDEEDEEDEGVPEDELVPEEPESEAESEDEEEEEPSEEEPSPSPKKRKKQARKSAVQSKSGEPAQKRQKESAEQSIEIKEVGNGSVARSAIKKSKPGMETGKLGEDQDREKRFEKWLFVPSV